MITQIRKVGNSAGVVIPAAVLKEVQLAVGNTIRMTVTDGTLTIRPLDPRRKGRRELSLDWLLEDFRDVETDIIPGAFGAEVLDTHGNQD